MKKSEIFLKVANIVCEHCECHFANILNGSKLQPVVDARMILIHELKRLGFSSHDIAVISMRYVAGNMTFDPNYMPDNERILHKSKSIDRQNKTYNDLYQTSPIFKNIADDVKREVGNIDRLILEHSTNATTTQLTT